MTDSFDYSAIHRPVLLDECVALVTPALTATDSVVVDCTLGLAGHATAFLGSAPNARLIGIDRDAQALDMASERMREAGFAERFMPAHAAFDEFDEVLERNHVEQIDAAFMDLGLSSLQIDEVDRGFSYSHDAPLDMRMDVSQRLDAATVVAQYAEDDLVRIFREYGQERFARSIARAIVRRRDVEPIRTSRQLDQLIDQVVPKSHRGKGNPAKRVFQALRIEVNGELDKLASTLPQIVNRLKPGGRLVVESYHSLEDRTVKMFMAQGLRIDAPAGLPVVPHDAEPFFRDLTRGALKAGEDEIARNPRSASVRLRGVELTRPVPDRWRSRFAAASDETDARRARMERARHIENNRNLMQKSGPRGDGMRHESEGGQ
jgi:16S rRNA (cytosine1402-N4)-methyltransferase